MDTSVKHVSSKTKEPYSGAKIVEVKQVDRSGRYRIGKPQRPPIHHDNGFLDQFPRRDPTAADQAAYAYWVAKVEVAEALRPDLADATAAYRHFLFGKGEDRTFSYERFVANDKSGEIVLRTILSDFRFNAEVIGVNREHFEITSDPYSIGGDSTFPYPITENWQKAIGAHVAWVSGVIDVATDIKRGKDIFTATVTIHIEDRYNFNPGAADIATGIPDSANGQFEVTGLGQQYMNYATLVRVITWIEGEGSHAKTSAPNNSRDEQRRPENNRRIRNRV